MPRKKSYANRTFKTDRAVVLDVQPGARSDRKVWFLCRQNGVVLCIAPAARRPRKTWGGLLSLLTIGTLTFKTSSNHPDWSYLVQFEHPWSPAIRKPMTPEYLRFASYLCELTRTLLSHHEPDSIAFDAFEYLIHCSVKNLPLRGLALGWTWFLLVHLGFIGLTGDCPGCGQTVSAVQSPLTWDAEGHPWHASCRMPRQPMDYTPASHEIRYLTALEANPRRFPAAAYRELARHRDLFRYLVRRAETVTGFPFRSLEGKSISPDPSTSS